jgi:hypothetical protein
MGRLTCTEEAIKQAIAELPKYRRDKGPSLQEPFELLSELNPRGAGYE